MLKTNPLAQAIYRFFSTHRAPLPYSLDTLSNVLGIQSVSERSRSQSFRMAVEKLNKLSPLTLKVFAIETGKSGQKIRCTKLQPLT